MASVPDGPDLRIVIVGRSGQGKSAVGNTILGEKCFRSSVGYRSGTQTCQKVVTRLGNRQISVVDTPGLLHSHLSEEIVKGEVVKSLKFSCSGPHVFLLVQNVGRFTSEDRDSVKYLQELFSPEVNQYTMVLFTYGDLLDDMTIHEHLDKCPVFQQLIRNYGNRFHVFNNKSRDRCQVVDLIKKIDYMVAGNGGTYYTDKETVTMKRLQDVLSAMNNFLRDESNDNYSPSFQVTVNVNINLHLKDTNSSHTVWEREVCLPAAGVKRLCVQGSSDQRLKDVRSSFIEGISGPVLKSLLDKLFEKKVLTDPERESADEMQNRGDKARFVIDTVRRKGEAASSEMIEFLREVDPFLCEHLLI